MPNVYKRDFFESHRKGSRRSAQVIVPLVLELLQPRSVVDVGCGTGSWLAVFHQHGVEEVLGIDSEHVPGEFLEISPDHFYAFDLIQPLRLERRFDLVLSLEVAEHLPPENADTFVESLVSLGPVLLFSAAVPGQGGTNHLNEQWPDYWVKRFARHGYVAIDALRPQIWNATDVEPWYVQNLLLFVAADVANVAPQLAAALARTRPGQLGVVHPRLFTDVRRNEQAATEAYTAVAAESAASRAKAKAFFVELEQLKGEISRHHATAEYYMTESAEHRAKAEAFFAELEQLKVAAAQHRATAEHHMAEAAEHRAKAEAFFAEVEQLKGEVARHHSTAEHYMTEAAEQRSKAEFYYAESTRLADELAATRAETERLAQETASALEDAERWRRRADPRTASLQRILRELPIVVVSALQRHLGRRRDVGGPTSQ